MNKKGNTNVLYIIIMFALLAMIGIFMMVFTYEIGRTEILQPILNITLDIEQSLGVSQEMQDHAVAIKDSYDGLEIPYDLFFLYLWISSIAASIAITLKSKKDSVFSFFGGMFITLMGLLLIVFFVDQVQEWFFLNIFNAVFSDITLSLPIMDYYFNNIGWISSIWFILLLFLRQVDLDINVGGRVQE